MSGEATKHVISHCFQAFATMGIPKVIKTDNGPGYTSKAFQNFCLTFLIQHLTGIPYNPQGQGIIERAHRLFKNQLLKRKGGDCENSVYNQLNHALFTLNFLQTDAQGHSTADRFWNPSPAAEALCWKDPLVGSWHGLDSVLVWGRGHVCVFPRTADGPQWLPERLVKQHHGETREPTVQEGEEEISPDLETG